MKIAFWIAASLAVMVLLRLFAKRGEEVRSMSAAVVGAPLTQDSVREFLLRGRKIEAIKAYRTLHGVDLKDAKEAVERLAAQLTPSR